MSTEQLQKNMPWEMLQRVLETAKDVPQEFKHLAKEHNGKVHYCTLGYAGKAMGYPDSRLVKDFGNADILDNYGFSSKVQKTIRKCPEPDCNEELSLGSLIAHLNDHHEIPINMIGKMLPGIRNDPTKVDQGFIDPAIEKIVNYIKRK